MERSYWRRRSYERLNGSGRKRKTAAAEADLPSIAEGSAKRRRFWRRLKLAPRIKVRFRFAPKKFFLGLRDAYVSMMMKLASVPMISAGGGGDAAFGVRPIKEYDQRMIMDIYRSIVLAQGQIVPRDAAWIGSEIASRRPLSRTILT
ncbi:hypothetical protein M569_15792 [Genlisea aurea]|uniref:Uncharacterized protein n=1 Tax=Genlisea aurea TaxID=192259 RepID=S8BXD1_9LAMI|nr:hypothetical protein M569_15792 [Genlisea aurea]